MSTSPPADRSADADGSPPARALHDADADRLWIVLDVAPARADDCSVAVDADRVHLTVDHPTLEGSLERFVTPPTGDRVFASVEEATYRNGVLTVTVVTATRSV